MHSPMQYAAEVASGGAAGRRRDISGLADISCYNYIKNIYNLNLI